MENSADPAPEESNLSISSRNFFPIIEIYRLKRTREGNIPDAVNSFATGDEADIFFLVMRRPHADFMRSFSFISLIFILYHLAVFFCFLKLFAPKNGAICGMVKIRFFILRCPKYKYLILINQIDLFGLFWHCLNYE